jgi:hypothetical protein
MDEWTGPKIQSAHAALLNRAVATMRGTHSTFHQASWSAAQDVIERLYPPLYHMTDLAEKCDELTKKTPSAPLSIQIEATPRSAAAPLMTVPFVPRDSTWHKLLLLRVRQWQHFPSYTASSLGGGSTDDSAESGGLDSDSGRLPSSSGLSICGAKLVFAVSFAGPKSADSTMHLEVSVSHVSVVSTGVFEAPFFRVAGLEIEYQERTAESWNSGRQGKLRVGLDTTRMLYVPDHMRVLDDIAHESAMHSRFAKSVRCFVPYELDLIVACRNSYVVRTGVPLHWQSYAAMQHRLRSGAREVLSFLLF